ncbi:hydrolase [Neolewinella marina]|uniref:Hydrolase n=1 Tax=Neolewinella marina TaxID=438751 RepID=A0A2G0CKV3_9BACT|nr:hydrolase [Neolewinella marina]
MTGLVLLATGLCPLAAQDAVKSITARYTEAEITLDGRLDEGAWATAEPIDDFLQYFPTDSATAEHGTEMRILYSPTMLYVGIRAETSGEGYVVTSLRRDFRGTRNDNVSMFFDTFRDGINAFMFGVTPYGVQREGLVSEGGEGFDNTWDAKWLAESEMHEDHYTIEMAIPFTSLKFPDAGDRWRFRPYRYNIQTNEQSTWVRVPQNQRMSSLAFMGELVFERPLARSRTPLALIPYVNARAGKDFTSEQTDNNFSFGGDAKVAIGNGMNLDLTINPDFSNVELDDIFTNLTRFEVLLPEKRQFFIDNSDLFASFGSVRDAVPFFSRRIGLARDTAGNLIENGILAGARLSGKLDQNWRLGFLNIQGQADHRNQIPSNNNSMLAVQRRVFSRSNVGAFIVNRQAFGEETYLKEEDRYNRVVGVDYNLASADNVWTGKFYLHKSFQPGDHDGNLSSQAFLIRDTRKWRFATDLVYVNEDFRSDLGFIPRKDYLKTGNFVGRNFYPKKGPLASHSFEVLALTWRRPSLDMKLTDYTLRFSWAANLRDQSTFELQAFHNYIFLANPFDPTRTPGAVPIPGDQGYYFNQVTAEFESNQASLVTFSANTGVGGFFNGHRYSLGGLVGVRVQPWAQFSLALNYDGLRLPDPHPDANLWLLTPRFDVTFSKSLFWLTLLQYSNQRNNLGINSRLQWRFAPLSDLYLVYNDNYYTDTFSPRFRSINLKVSYWLNL